MKCILITILIPLVFLIICACGGSAHADMTDADIAEANLVNLVKKHIRPAPIAGNYDHRLYGELDNSKAYAFNDRKNPGADIRAIDNNKQDAIQISQERTSRPDEFMDMPTSKRDMERYNGR